MIDTSNLNVPLLRKTVEWAESEAAKPRELCEWYQDSWASENEGFFDYYDENDEYQTYVKDPSCGTCFCIGGYVAHLTLQQGEHIAGSFIYRGNREVESIADRAARELGIVTEPGRAGYLALFAAGNTIEDVRIHAEELAGERL
jgi:hypothetical protein